MARGDQLSRQWRLIRFLVTYYGPTGNVAVLATGVPEEVIRAALAKAVPKPYALLSPELSDEVEATFRDWAAPPGVEEFRWTR